MRKLHLVILSILLLLAGSAFAIGPPLAVSMPIDYGALIQQATLASITSIPAAVNVPVPRVERTVDLSTNVNDVFYAINNETSSRYCIGYITLMSLSSEIVPPSVAVCTRGADRTVQSATENRASSASDFNIILATNERRLLMPARI